MIVFFTQQAEDDLEKIADYIAHDNPTRAVSFVLELVERCEGLSGMPNAFALVPRYESSGVRRRPYGSCLIFYRLKEHGIDILHVLNGAQDYEAILFPDAGRSET